MNWKQSTKEIERLFAKAEIPVTVTREGTELKSVEFDLPGIGPVRFGNTSYNMQFFIPEPPKMQKAFRVEAIMDDLKYHRVFETRTAADNKIGDLLSKGFTGDVKEIEVPDDFDFAHPSMQESPLDCPF